MAGVADKARFYLERAAPQLREFEDKEIFSGEEIKSLVNKRSDFEHLVLAPGARPAEFLAYVAWERSLDRLRAKRCRRLRVHASNSHPSEARTFGIFERAVMKHPGSVPLWTAYLDFAASAKAAKRWRRIVTRALRLHPTNAGLWILAGQRAANSGDMEHARAHFLRGCRFCTGEPTLWVEYARCEMEWLAKIEAKKGGKGVRKGANVMEAIKATEATEQEGDVIAFDEDDDDSDAGEDAMLVLPDPDAGKKAMAPVFGEEETKKLEQSPALSGAIPMAIFDVARKQRFYGAPTAEIFFDMFSQFLQVSSQEKIIDHVLGAMEEFSTHPSTCNCKIRQPLAGVEPQSVEFPRALRDSLNRLRAAMETTDNKKVLAQKTIAWVEPILKVENLDAGIRTVLEHTKRSMGELSSRYP
ncbi:U3 small nucleolar RNA-associated protein 6-domain-containing protein [Lasiosphaeris hirsuta]|uniref:U3 small nucleolar RNA-associated protein 6-domain-containing protein n=1 Tax=Lasiosphaeris hirsuta TaxID=260670 RepID=A0AA40AYT0_9PEZI|nr:U3 small nucleolar RNA-associated protein 6-domain-containing protein [Lasiosphaeris hirsuta]